ncbi:MAG TPA: restriction endonuclease subunit S [Leptospiraceae bacterium]|nr:restriction endonuclease subunit S [Leptospiraceae bacterium]HMW04712.1 restriction endonuclease subunit S [Leptospiraceae bacterium]HMX31743.1 restriction endonuclease subunit S [Leptospiraceae bacterium]HMY30549.1 restriction endonuclease subunit S [Leptospiraceae bacterium]HMZ64150.1 restriction endonuclease subunit S [Leptospiraceae bacterium]
MKSNYKRIGDFIRLVDERNTGLKVQELIGLTISKQFIPSVANTIGSDMENYKIIRQNQFACSLMQVRRDKKIPVALLKDKEVAIISQAYPIFEIINTKHILPEYLMMWFSRKEFDREACFYAVGGVRGSLEWEDFSNMKLPVPSIEKQKEIVKEYNVILNRIELNNQLIQKLEETAQAIYKQWFVDGVDKDNLPEGWRVGKLRELCEYSNKRIQIEKLNLNNYISTENMIQNRGGITKANNLPNTNNFTNFEIGNILISNIRPYFKKIWLADFNGGCSNDVLCLVPFNNIPSLYLYQILEKDNFFDYVMAGSKGTKMPRGDKKWIMNYPAIIPDKKILEKFNLILTNIQKKIFLMKQEEIKLLELEDFFVSKLATEGRG